MYAAGCTWTITTIRSDAWTASSRACKRRIAFWISTPRRPAKRSRWAGTVTVGLPQSSEHIRTCKPRMSGSCRPARQDPLIRGLHVRMCSDDCGSPTVTVPAHRDLFAGRLGVEIQKAMRRLQALEEAVHASERIVVIVHVHPAAYIHHRQLDTIFLDRREAAARD